MDTLTTKTLALCVAAVLLFMLLVRIVYIAVEEPRNLSRPGYIVMGLVMPHPPGAAPLPAEAQPDWTAALMKADRVAGASLSQQCAGCHDLSATATNQIGPPLYGILGRARATNPGFNYSGAMLSQHDPWTAPALFAFLRDPQLSVPGTRMSSSGIPDAQQRINLIAYLQSLSAPAAP